MKMITNPEVAAIAEELDRSPEMRELVRNYLQLSDRGKKYWLNVLIPYFLECKQNKELEAERIMQVCLAKAGEY